MFDRNTPKLQVDTLPEGYSIITSGKIQPGDIRWNPWTDSWMLDSPLTEERHGIVMGAPVTGFHGICRKTELIKISNNEQVKQDMSEYQIVDLNA